VVLTNGDVDHVAGLLSLRESQPFAIYGTRSVQRAIAESPIFGVVSTNMVPRVTVEPGSTVSLPGGLACEIFMVPGKVPLYQEGDEVEVGLETDATVGLRISAGDARCYYVPGCASITPALRDRLRGADLVLFDGTLFRDDEMIREGLGSKTGRRMGHVSMSGPEGAMAGLDGLGIGRKVFIHINNTNPVLIDGSPERRQVEAAGWEIAHDGQEIAL